MTQPDFIIVGSGSAGSVLARKLSDADAGHVLVLEAGDHHTDNTAIHNPAEWATLWDTDVDWGYKTTPQVHTAGRVHDWPRGKVLGGTSCLNAMQYIRGHRTDFLDEHRARGFNADARKHGTRRVFHRSGDRRLSRGHRGRQQ